MIYRIRSVLTMRFFLFSLIPLSLYLCFLLKPSFSSNRASLPVFRKPLIISSPKFVEHRSRGWHPECPDRLLKCENVLHELEMEQLVIRDIPSSEKYIERKEKALKIISTVHDAGYINEVQTLCEKGARILSPWDEDTYISRSSFNISILAQSAWLDGVDEVVKNKNVAFALTRPPGHHAVKGASMGFCIFNFAVGAATYALEDLNLERVGIIDFDVHYGNGVADLVANNPKIRYTSLHQFEIFPNSGSPDVHGAYGNILNIPLSLGCDWSQYEPLIRDKAIPFLEEFRPDLVIVCAGYDAMATDDMAQINLLAGDYGHISRMLKQSFGPVLFGLEGGYNVDDLPAAIEATLSPYLT